MSTASAAGPDGLRPSHLRQLIGPDAGGSREQLLEALGNFASLCTKGQVPQEAAPYFFGAALCALRKKDGAARPIAVGCAIRRVISKAICFTLRNKSISLLSPRQLGVGVKNGAVTAAHAARRFLSTCTSNSGLLKLDFQNAFNALDRSEMLTAVNKHIPELFSYTFAAYATPSHLIYIWTTPA